MADSLKKKGSEVMQQNQRFNLFYLMCSSLWKPGALLHISSSTVRAEILVCYASCCKHILRDEEWATE